MKKDNLSLKTGGTTSLRALLARDYTFLVRLLPKPQLRVRIMNFESLTNDHTSNERPMLRTSTAHGTYGLVR